MIDDGFMEAITIDATGKAHCPVAGPIQEPEPAAPEPGPFQDTGIAENYANQCDCDGNGNELPDGSYIISIAPCRRCAYC